MYQGKVELAYIIDDDEVIIYLTDIIIKNVEFCEKLSTFTKANDALESLKVALETGKNIPSVILIDLNMPVMDGWRFLDELVKLDTKKQIPVFIFTSSIDSRDMERAQKYGIVKDYIIKPLTIHKINKILRLLK
ncbi:MAG TPA: response regulator [Bacteroidia bacterium]